MDGEKLIEHVHVNLQITSASTGLGECHPPVTSATRLNIVTLVPPHLVILLVPVPAKWYYGWPTCRFALGNLHRNILTDVEI